MTLSKEKKPGKKFPSLRLPAGQRIRSRGVFKLIFEKGRSARGSVINVWTYGLGQEDSPAQLGIVVSRKTSGRATVRNQWKRRLREAFRKNQHLLKSGLKILLQARYVPQAPSYDALEKEMKALFEKLKVLK